MDLFDIVAARQGGTGGGAPQKQADWNQNDSSKKDYVKNRTHWKEEVERDYTVLPNVEHDPITGFIEYGKKIGLEIGKEYTLEAHLVDGTVETIQAIATEIPEDEIGIAGIPCFMFDFGIVVDGVGVFDFTTQTILAGDNCYYHYDSSVTSILKKIIIQNLPNTETVVHKIPNEFIDFPEIEMPTVDQDYDSNSQNAQSGIAVEQAINEYDKSLMIGAEKLVDKSVTTEKLADKSVTTEKIADSSVDKTKIKDKAVTSEKIYPYAIRENHLDSGAVTTHKIANENISGNKLVRPSIIMSQIVSSEAASWGCTMGSAQEAVIYGKVVSSDTESTSQVFLVRAENMIVAQATLDFSDSRMYYFMCRIKLLTTGIFLVDFSITSDMQNASPEISFSHYVNVPLGFKNYIYSVNVQFGDVSTQKLAVGTEIYYYEILGGYVN